MQKIRYGLIVLGLLLCLAAPAAAEVNIDIGGPRVNIHFSLPVFPELVLLPGLPIYFAPRVEANYFFYDGLYWVYLDDAWYASDWYDGPWWLVEPDYVPLFILRIPVRYYRVPPPYFRDWSLHQPPRWGHRWGRDWDHRHRGWERWQRDSVPPPAPIPVYQRPYAGERYPRGEEQRRLRGKHYRYQPRDREVREHVQPRIDRRDPPALLRDQRVERPPRGPRPQESPRVQPPRSDNRNDMRAPPRQRPPMEQRGPGEYGRRPPRTSDRERELPKLHGEGRNSQNRATERGNQRGPAPQQERDRERGDQGPEKGQEEQGRGRD